MRRIVTSSKILPGAIPHPARPEAPVTPAARREYVRTLRPRYTLAPRRAKPAILDEFCATTGYHRKYAIRLLNCPHPTDRHAPPPSAGLFGRGRHDPGGDLGGGRLSLVPPPAGAPAALAPLGAPPLCHSARPRPPVAPDQSQYDRPAPASPETPGAPPPVRAHQTRHPAQAPYPAAHRALARHHARVHRSRPRRPFRQFGRWRLSPVPQSHRSPYRLGRVLRRARQDPTRRPRRRGRAARCPPFSPPRPRFRQRVRIHQYLSLPVLSGAPDPVHARPAVSERRQCARRAEELDPCAQALGLGPL